MIIYEKGSIMGLSLDFMSNLTGSALPRAFVSSMVSVCIYIGLSYGGWNDFSEVGHPYTVGILASITCFAIIFRSQSAIARYYEAARETHSMQSKMADAISMAVTFSFSGVNKEKGTPSYQQRKAAHEEFCRIIIHAASLFVSTAYLILRDDSELNYCAHKPGHIPPTSISPGAGTFRPIYYKDPLTWLRNTFTFANGKEKHRQAYYAYSKFPVIGQVTRREEMMLRRANGALAKAHLVMHWITECITTYYLKGGFGDVQPPIISRLYQEISNGMLGFNQAKRIAHLPFPFIYAQLTEFLVMVLLVAMPVMMLEFVSSKSMGGIFTFFACMGFCSLYEATRELEDPFLFEPNDLPLLTWAGEFNEMLLLLNKYSSGSDDWERVRSISYDMSDVELKMKGGLLHSVGEEEDECYNDDDDDDDNKDLVNNDNDDEDLY